MTELSQVPTDFKKFFDEALKQYLPKRNQVRTLYSAMEVDPGTVTHEYVRQTQTYTEAKGYLSFRDPMTLADGTSPELDSIGTEALTSSPTTYATAYRFDRKLFNSSKPIQQALIAQHAVQMVNTIENKVNRLLIANMATNAAQTYTALGDTWADGGDPVADINVAKSNFFLRSGGVEADFILTHPTDYAAIKNDQRFQNTFFTSKSLESGEIIPKPLNLEWMRDSAMTQGTFLMGKRGMFGNLMITENYKTFEKDEQAAGRELQGLFSFEDQYPLPYYLMLGSGI